MKTSFLDEDLKIAMNRNTALLDDVSKALEKKLKLEGSRYEQSKRTDEASPFISQLPLNFNSRRSTFYSGRSERVSAKPPSHIKDVLSGPSTHSHMVEKLGSHLSTGKYSRPLTASRRDLIRELTSIVKEDKEENIERVKKEENVEDEVEDDWETDIEMEERAKTPFDLWGKTTYRRTCSRLAITPVSFIERHLQSSNLSMIERGLKPRETLALCHALMVNTTINGLNLMGNNMGDIGMKYIAWMLTDNNNIKNLNLSSNKLGSASAVLLNKVLINNCVITKLNLSGNFFTDNDAHNFSTVLEDTKTLQEIDLSHNSFGDVAGRLFGRAIASNDSIRKLNLSWNKIRPRGGVWILRGLSENVMLKNLNLAMNGVSNEAVIAAAQALRRNDGLQELDLTNNRIYDEGILSVARALEHNDSLQVLKVGQNHITTIGAMALLNGIRKNDSSAIHTLDLSCIHVHRDALLIQEEIKETRPKFKLAIGGVIYCDHAYEDIRKSKGGIINKNPLTILKWYINSNNYRLIDVFKRFDKDGSLSVSRNEFLQGLKDIKVPLTEGQLDELIKKLDKDGDGEIDFGELMEADQLHRKQKRRRNKLP